MRSDQGRTFVEGEGDRWFSRNRRALEAFDVARDLPLRLLELYHVTPSAVLEVGAANGVRLAVIAERHESRAVALDPSVAALQHGRPRFPRVAFVCGVADACPLAASFDLIIINFVLHWIDRVRLLRSVAEVDRLLQDGGYLIVGDFHPAGPTKVAYHHRADLRLYTYKQDYAAIFIASGLYHPVGFLSGDHTTHALTGEASEAERIGAWLLRKALHGGYREFVDPSPTPPDRGPSRLGGDPEALSGMA